MNNLSKKYVILGQNLHFQANNQKKEAFSLLFQTFFIALRIRKRNIIWR